MVAHPASPPDVYRPGQTAGLIWVAEDAGALIGFGACQAFGPELHLWELAVRHEAQGHGAGRALLAAAVEEARRRGLSAITLTTFAEISWNAPFYERLGFRRLASGDLDARLEAVLAEEAGRGLTDRCAMRLDL